MDKDKGAGDTEAIQETDKSQGIVSTIVLLETYLS